MHLCTFVFTETKDTMEKKDSTIETLRGIAILLVVVGHVIGSGPDGGMKIDFPSSWRYLYLWIDYIQLPLFTAIAGWAYAFHPFKEFHFQQFLRKKATRLLLPMVIVGTLYFLTQYVVPGTNRKGDLSEIWRIYVFPYTIYWYLPSLFLMSLAMAFLDKIHVASTFSKWVLCIVVSYFLLLGDITILDGRVENYFSFRGAILQMPYFLIGLGIHRFKKELTIKSVTRTCYLLTLCGILLIQIRWFLPELGTTIHPYFQTAFSMSTCILCLTMHFKKSFFVWIGRYSYAIYLLHVFGTAGGRILTKRVGYSEEWIVFSISFAVAIIFPIVAEKLIDRSKIGRLLFFGH